MGARGFRRCTMPLHREHEAAARVILARHNGVVAVETIAYSGQHLSFSIDLARVPEGEAGLVEAVIVRDIERGVRP